MSGRGLGCYPLGLRPAVLYALTLQLTKPAGFWARGCAGVESVINRDAYRAGAVAGAVTASAGV